MQLCIIIIHYQLLEILSQPHSIASFKYSQCELKFCSVFTGNNDMVHAGLTRSSLHPTVCLDMLLTYLTLVVFSLVCMLASSGVSVPLRFCASRQAMIQHCRVLTSNSFITMVTTTVYSCTLDCIHLHPTALNL